MKIGDILTLFETRQLNCNLMKKGSLSQYCVKIIIFTKNIVKKKNIALSQILWSKYFIKTITKKKCQKNKINKWQKSY